MENNHLVYPIERCIVGLPIKVFEYMACPLPMVMSNFPYWQGAFSQYALFANPYASEDIADRILCLLDDPDKAKQLGDKGRQLTQEKYSWEVEQRKLLDVYDRVLGSTQNE